jgi:hypothetical protein
MPGIQEVDEIAIRSGDEGQRAGATQGAREFREDRQVGMQADAINPAYTQREQRPLMLEPVELTLGLLPHRPGLALAGRAAPLRCLPLVVGPGERPLAVSARRRLRSAALDALGVLFALAAGLYVPGQRRRCWRAFAIRSTSWRAGGGHTRSAPGGRDVGRARRVARGLPQARAEPRRGKPSTPTAAPAVLTCSRGRRLPPAHAMSWITPETTSLSPV